MKLTAPVLFNTVVHATPMRAHPQALLSATCKAAYEALAERACVALERRVLFLEHALYHERLPALAAVMARFNRALVQCTCAQCQAEGRYPHGGTLAAPWPGTACRFIPAWEAHLEAAGASVEVDRGDVATGADVIEHKFHGSRAAIYMREYEWVEPVRWVAAYGWGRPLSSLDSPRRAAWDRVARVPASGRGESTEK